MYVLLEVILMVLDIYRWVVIAMIIASWLIAFNVVNTRNEFVNQVWRILNQLTEPVLRPIRRIMPKFSGLDLSPIVLFIIIFFIEQIIVRYLMPYVF
jgi:YggT family protein